MPTIDTLLERINDLPTLPAVAIELTAMLDEPETRIKDVEAIVKQDLSLSAKILKLVNSAFYCLPTEVQSISHAINILGFNSVKSMVLSTFVFDFFSAGSSRFDLAALWMHSMSCGVAAEQAASIAGRKGDFFVFGLLHDLGRLLLRQLSPAQFEEAVKISREDRISLTAAEKQVFGISHMEAGMRLAERWRFSPELTECLSRHHLPMDSPIDKRDLVSLIHVADVVSLSLALGDSNENRIELLSQEALDLLGFDQAKLGRIMDMTLDNLKSCGPMFSLLGLA